MTAWMRAVHEEGGLMRKRMAGGIALAAAGIMVLAACASSTKSASASTPTGPAILVPGAIGQVYPAASGQETAGAITWAEQPGDQPTWLLPLTAGGENTVFNLYTFEWELYRPTYWTINGVSNELDPSMSLAEPAKYSDHDRQVSITFKSSYRWSDGTPVDADDLMFDIDLIKAAIKASPANWSGYTPGYFPDDLASMSEPNSRTLVLHLTKPVNPVFFTDDVLGQGPTNPLPVQTWARDAVGGPPVTDWKTNPADDLKIYNFLVAQNKSVSTYASNPLWKVVDGPYKLASYTPASGAYTLTPNPDYGGPHATRVSTFQAVPFTSETAEFNAILAGQIDVAQVPLADVPKLNEVTQRGYNYFGEPDFGFNAAFYNFKDGTGDFANIVDKLYFREAMQHLEDQASWIRAFFNGAGSEAYGSIPVFPQNQFLPSDAASNPYPFSVSAAISVLKQNGWTVNPEGTDVCGNPGTGAGQCGAGIPAGTKLTFNLIYATAPDLIGEQMDNLAQEALAAGIKITLQPSNFGTMLNNYVDSAFPANDNKWAMEDFGGEGLAPYPTTFGIFNKGAGGQIGDYYDPQADSLINASISSGAPSAVGQEASYLTLQLPVMWQPEQDLIWAWKTNLSGQPAAFENLTQYYATPEFWYFTNS
jgi:peptide/nickel transport system substrate-binding protein